MIDKEKRKEWELKNQYRIPKHFEYIAERYGRYMTYNTLIMFFQMSVTEVLLYYNVETLGEVSFGRGYAELKNRWIDKMQRYIQIQNKEDEFKKYNNEIEEHNEIKKALFEDAMGLIN